jgi:hypothetical protein
MIGMMMRMLFPERRIVRRRNHIPSQETRRMRMMTGMTLYRSLPVITTIIIIHTERVSERVIQCDD